MTDDVTIFEAHYGNSHSLAFLDASLKKVDAKLKKKGNHEMDDRLDVHMIDSGVASTKNIESFCFHKSFSSC